MAMRSLGDYYNDRSKFQSLQDDRNANMLARKAGTMLSTGDSTGARNALWSGGQLDAGYKVDAQIGASQKSQAEALDRFTAGIGKMIESGYDPQEAWSAAAPFGQRLGIDMQTLEKHKSEYDRDPKAWAAFWNDTAKREKAEFAKGSDGSYTAADPYTGKPLYQYQAPTADRYEQFDPDKEIRRIPGRPGSVVGTAPDTVPINPGINPDAPPSQGEMRSPIAPPMRGAAAPNASQTEAFVKSIGGQVTSGARTPEDNARVGGVANSYHLTTRGGVARDFVPPQGVSMNDFHRQVQQNLPPGWEAINEGDHIHIEPGSYRVAAQGGTPAPPRSPEGAGAPELVRPAQRAPGGRMATPQEKAALGLPADQPVWIGKDGKPDVVSTGPAASNPRKAEADLRKEFNARPEVKEYRDVDASYRTISKLASQPPSAAGDMSLIFAFMKMLDPGSVVREGEFANAQNTAGIPDRIRNAYNKALNGQRLSQHQRAEFTSQAGVIHSSRKDRFGQIEQEYRGYAQDYGLDPARISATQQTTPGGNGQGGAQAAFSPQQRTTAQKLAKAPNFKSLPVGSKGRPYAPRSEAEFAKIPPGGFYIDDDGSVFQKGR